MSNWEIHNKALNNITSKFKEKTGLTVICKVKYDHTCWEHIWDLESREDKDTLENWRLLESLINQQCDKYPEIKDQLYGDLDVNWMFDIND